MISLKINQSLNVIDGDFYASAQCSALDLQILQQQADASVPAALASVLQPSFPPQTANKP